MSETPTGIKTLTNFYKFELQNSEFQIVAPDILTYKANVGQQWWKNLYPRKILKKLKRHLIHTPGRTNLLRLIRQNVTGIARWDPPVVLAGVFKHA
ncbi:hypothetical protein CWS02_08185 [Enterobacter sp. EA-1]|nr:hypothetical protein CWS02_08185 [Enterobacter sp. EA-1]